MAKKRTRAEGAPRPRKKAEKMPEGTFAAKLRIGPVTEAHMNRLAQMKGLKMRKCTRNVMKAHLHNVCALELARILTLPALVLDGVMPPSDDDLLG